MLKVHQHNGECNYRVTLEICFIYNSQKLLPHKGLLPCLILTTQTATFESAASDNEVWNMSLQLLAVMATEANQCQNVPFLYTNIKMLLYSLPFSLWEPRCGHIVIYFMESFPWCTLLLCGNLQPFHHKVNCSEMPQLGNQSRKKKSFYKQVRKLVFGFVKKRVICTDLHVCVCKCLIHLHNCFKNVQFTAANRTSAIKGKHLKMHFSSKMHRDYLYIWQLIWALYQTFHRLEGQDSGWKKTNQTNQNNPTKFKPKASS